MREAFCCVLVDLHIGRLASRNIAFEARFEARFNASNGKATAMLF
jgi:hypothetical protein